MLRYSHNKTGMVLSTLRHRAFFSDELGELLSDRQRVRDITGVDIGVIMAKTGWMFQAAPILSTASIEGSAQHASAGWAARIEWGDGSPGVNLSYATHQKSEGLGLGRICCALSFLRLCEETPLRDLGAVNIQCRADNIAAQKIATRLGFSLNPGSSFVVESLGAKFLAFTTPAEDFKRRCAALLEQHCTPMETMAEADQPRWRG